MATFAKSAGLFPRCVSQCLLLLIVVNCIGFQRNEAREEPLHSDPDHYRKLYTCFSLFTVLYLPESGFEDAPIGDELMEWLNTNYIEPSTEEGDHLSSLERPWEDENFWSYVAR